MNDFGKKESSAILKYFVTRPKWGFGGGEGCTSDESHHYGMVPGRLPGGSRRG